MLQPKKTSHCPASKKSYGGTGDLYVEKPKAGRDLTLAAAGNLYTDELTAPGNVTAKAGGNITVDTVKCRKRCCS